MPDKCANCRATIGDLEEAFVWKDHPICKSCYGRLNLDKGSSNSKTKLIVLVAAVLIIAIGSFAYLFLNRRTNTTTLSGSSPTSNPPNLQTSVSATPPADSVVSSPPAIPTPAKTPEPESPLVTAKGIYNKTVANADTIYVSVMSNAKTDLSAAFDKAISGTMKKGDSQSLDLANRLNEEKKQLLANDASTSNTPVFNPNPAEILQLLKNRTWYWHWEKLNKDNPGDFVIAASGRITTSQQPDVEWNIVQRWVLFLNGHIFVPVDENTLNGFFIESGRQAGLFSDQPVASGTDSSTEPSDINDSSSMPSDLAIALKKYGETTEDAENTHNKTIEGANKQLVDSYDTAIAAAMQNGADGLAQANRLTTEKQNIAVTNSQSDKSLPFNPTRDEILQLLPGRTWYWHWEHIDKKSPVKIDVKPDGRIVSENDPKSVWTLARRWILTHDAHVLIPVDQKTFRGFYIPSGRQVGLFTEQKLAGS